MLIALASKITLLMCRNILELLFSMVKDGLECPFFAVNSFTENNGFKWILNRTNRKKATAFFPTIITHIIHKTCQIQGNVSEAKGSLINNQLETYKYMGVIFWHVVRLRSSTMDSTHHHNQEDHNGEHDRRSQLFLKWVCGSSCLLILWRLKQFVH